ncbi:MAG TPA: phosphodiester glycosidase family protein [Candidatus Eremiobacteraceae bacterium]|nr:phosphodiester glycosidase family protein [Candidatus Eremiobacteraceae bacterium]
MSFRVRLGVTAFIILCGILSLSAAIAQSQEQPAAGASPAAQQFPQPAGWPAILRADKSEEILGPGVRYEHWKLATATGPLQISIAIVDARNPNVTFAVTSHQGIVQGGDERLSSMADRVHAELGINADYFDINESGAPLNILAEGSHLVHPPDAAASFIVLSGNRILMQPATWHATITTAAGAVRQIGALNEWSPASTLSLLTPELGRGDASGTLEIVFTPQAQPAGATAQSTDFRVSAIVSNAPALAALTSGQLALAARGSQAQSLTRDFAIGDSVSIDLDTDPPLAGMQLAVGGGPLLLQAGSYVADPAAPAPEETNVRNPVTAAGLDASGSTLRLVVVDGRSPGTSVGLTRPMLAALMAALGCVTAMAFDSGGSTEMVVRHLGDAGVSVANTPSDGRERAIADGLFVVNSAPAGPPQQLVVRAAAQSVLTGSHLQIFTAAVDANDQPLALDPAALHYSVAPTGNADISAAGLLTARASGEAVITASAGTIASSARVAIVPEVSSLRILGFNRVVAPKSRLPLAIVAEDADSQAIAVDSEAVLWQAQGSGGSLNADGVFTSAAQAGTATVNARVGSRSASVLVLTGDHPVAVQERLQAGPRVPQWHFRAQPAGSSGGLDNAAAPDGSPALRLRYDFSAPATTRAAYAESTLPLCGQPLAVSIDVFGDANGEWLRGGYRNADGNNESLTLARHVDWHGWRTVRAPVPYQAAWPIEWTRFYTVERGQSAREQGTLWLRNFFAIYAGPSSLGCN